MSLFKIIPQNNFAVLKTTGERVKRSWIFSNEYLPSSKALCFDE